MLGEMIRNGKFDAAKDWQLQHLMNNKVKKYL